MENIGDIVSRLKKDHCLEGAPSEEELEEHLANLFPPSIVNYVTRYKMSGNVLLITVSDPVTRQELSLRSNEIRELLNARLGRNAVGRIKARTKR